MHWQFPNLLITTVSSTSGVTHRQFVASLTHSHDINPNLTRSGECQASLIASATCHPATPIPSTLTDLTPHGRGSCYSTWDSAPKDSEALTAPNDRHFSIKGTLNIPN